LLRRTMGERCWYWDSNGNIRI